MLFQIPPLTLLSFDPGRCRRLSMCHHEKVNCVSVRSILSFVFEVVLSHYRNSLTEDIGNHSNAAKLNAKG